VDKGMKNIAWSVGKFVEKGKLSETKEAVLGRVKGSTDISQAKDADLVVEAIFERLDLKQELFKKLDKVCKPEALLASNSSTIPITELAGLTERPTKALGLHFFNPPTMMDVVEVIKGVSTSEETMEAGIAFVKQLKKEPIRVETDIPGFLLNRVNLISYVEAIRLVESGVGTVEGIDKGIRLGFGRKMGPFETGDLVGLDVSCNGLKAIYEETKDLCYYPPQLLRRKVRAGQLGRKAGQGWYKYEKV
jgi:3-hydroxybutyryl-CoA dehydrogenase